jgi:Flavodoxin reductases (ferredoxin-NADPH reductases) family 1
VTGVPRAGDRPSADDRVTHMTHDATVVDTYQVTPRVQGLRLRVPGHEFDYEPGQHTTVRFDSAGEEVVRPYTPTNLPGSDQLALTVRRYDDGLASSYLHQKRPGDTVRLGPVEGSLTLSDPDRDVAFLASGTGLTPMMAMLRQYLREGTGDAHVVYGDRHEETLIHRETLNELAANHPNLQVSFTLSDPNWEWTGRAGYVQDHLESLFDSFEARDHYVCGVPPMVVQTKDRLAALGAPDTRIHTEGWEDGAVED